MQGKRILVIDDDPEIRNLIKIALSQRGYDVHTAQNGIEGMRQYYMHQPDLVITDVMMPEMDGWQVCNLLEQVSDVPIILVTAVGGEHHEIRGLESCAVDYIVKPFSPKVLAARVQAALRHVSPLNSVKESAFYRDEHLTIDLGSRRVLVSGEAVKLTPTEYEVLAYLVQNTGRVLTHQQILDSIWGWEYQESVDYVHVYISQLRRKLEPNPKQPKYLLTERGVGYRFELQSG